MELVNNRIIAVALFVMLIVYSFCLAKDSSFVAEYCVYADTLDGFKLDTSNFIKISDNDSLECEREEVIKTKEVYYYLRQVSKLDTSNFIKISDNDSLECEREEVIETKSGLYSAEEKIAEISTYSASGRGGCGGEIHSGISCIDMSVPSTNIYYLDSLIETNNIMINSKFKDSYQKNVAVKWQAQFICLPHYDTTFSGSYFIRIIGECNSVKTRWFEK